VVAIPPKLDQELSDVRLRREEDEENCLGGHGRNDRHTAAILEHGGQQLGASDICPQFISRSYDGRDQSRQPLGVDTGHGLTINEETVAPEHDRCFDSFALSNRSHEIPDACHLDSSRQVVAKLEIAISEVKR